MSSWQSCLFSERQGCPGDILDEVLKAVHPAWSNYMPTTMLLLMKLTCELTPDVLLQNMPPPCPIGRPLGHNYAEHAKMIAILECGLQHNPLSEGQPSRH